MPVNINIFVFGLTQLSINICEHDLINYISTNFFNSTKNTIGTGILITTQWNLTFKTSSDLRVFTIILQSNELRVYYGLGIS